MNEGRIVLKSYNIDLRDIDDTKSEVKLNKDGSKS